MDIADHNFPGHVNVLDYCYVAGESGFQFEVDANTEGGRCLVLLNVHDLSVITACRVVIMTFILRFLNFFNLSVSFFKLFFKFSLLEPNVNK